MVLNLFSSITPIEVFDQPNSSGAGVSVTTLRSPYETAPEGFVFHLTLSGFDTNTPALETDYDASFSDKYVFWDYGDSYTFAAPTQVAALDASDSGNRTDSRYSRGPVGSHTYRAAGDYVVRVTVYEPSSGKWGQATVNIGGAGADTPAVGATADLFPTTQTLFVDTDGTYPNSPSGATNYDNIDAALTALDAATVPTRVLLERDQTHTITSNFNYRPPAGAASTTFWIEGRAGAGADPIVTFSGGSNESVLLTDNSRRDGSGGTASATVFKGVSFLGLYDPASNTGVYQDFVQLRESQGAEYILIDDCTIHGFNAGIEDVEIGGGTQNPDRVIVLNDMAIEDWRNIGIYGGQGSTLALAGVKIAQNVDARMNIASTVTLPCLRLGNLRRFLAASCDFFNSNGYSDLGQGTVFTAVQPAIRVNGAPDINGLRYCFTENVIESGRHPVRFSVYTTAQVRRYCNALFDSNLMIAGFQAGRVVVNAYGGATYRNNIMTISGDHNSGPDGGGTVGLVAFMDLSGGTVGDGTNETTPVDIYNNTMINLTASTIPEFSNGSSFTQLTSENNLVVSSSSSTTYDPLTVTSAVTPRYNGFTAEDGTEYPAYATPAAGGSVYAPDTGSAALDASDTLEPLAVSEFTPNYGSGFAIAAADRDVGAVEA